MVEPADPSRETIAEIEELDGLLEHRVRLAVCILLSAHDTVSFSWLKQALGETDGNLGAHLRKLEGSNYVTAVKSFRDRRPVTWYQVTGTGRKQLRQHLESLKSLLERAVP